MRLSKYLWVILFLTNAALARAADSESWSLVFRPQTVQRAPLLLESVVVKKETSPILLQKYGSLEIAGLVLGESLQPAQLIQTLNDAGADISKVVIRKSSETQGPSDDSSEEAVAKINKSILKEMAKMWSCPEEDISLEILEYPIAIPSNSSFSNIRVDIFDKTLAKITFEDFQKKIISTAEVPLRVEIKVPVLVLKQTVSAGQTITANNLNIEKKVVDVPANYISDMAEIEKSRFQSKTLLEANHVLKKEDVTALADMQVGAVVTLLLKGSQLQIKTLGRVKEVLDHGARVSVENLDSKKVVIGKPLNTSEVEIAF